jgi:hypothetical protein
MDSGSNSDLISDAPGRLFGRTSPSCTKMQSAVLLPVHFLHFGSLFCALHDSGCEYLVIPPMRNHNCAYLSIHNAICCQLDWTQEWYVLENE